MRLSIPRQELVRLLSNTTKVTEARNTIPILSNVRLVADGGRLTATATDLDIEATASTAIMADMDGGICVEAKLLDDIAKKLPASADVLLEVKDGSLLVASGRSRFTLQTLPVADFPDMNSGGLPTEFEADLAALFAPVKMAISTEETRYYLNGIYLHVVDGNLVAVATDSHKLSRHTGQEAPAFAGIIVPRKLVSILPTGTVKVALSDTKIRVTAGDFIFTSKLIDGTFPDYQRVIPTGNDKVITFDSSDMAAAVGRVTVISNEKVRAIKFAFADGAAALAVANSDRGSASEEIPVQYDGDPIEVGLNAAYLAETIAAFPAGDIKLKLADAGSPTLFMSDSAPNQLAVIMPTRV